MNKLKIIFTFTFFISGILLAQSQNVNKENLIQTIKVLASDTLEGRKAGSPGDVKATNFIINKYKEIGININDSLLQKFEIITDVKTGDYNKLIINNKEFVFNQDFKPLFFSASGTFKSTACFAGYGFDINEDSLTWNDYENINPKNKWVVIFRADPEMDKADSRFIPYSSERSKVITAKDKGAGGVIFITGKTIEEKDILMDDYFDKIAKDAGIPVLNITRAVADYIFKPLGKSCDELEKYLNDNRKPTSFDINFEINATTDLKQVKATTNNIIACIPGNDPLLKNEYIIIGAHYDHLGFGGPNSGSRMPDTIAVHYGADDNASGVSAVMELARLFNNSKSNKRSLLFIAFAGEEMGLLGSKYFVNNPVVPLSNIKTVINIDMIGRMNNNKIEIGGTGTSSVFDSIINKCSKTFNHEITRTTDGYGPSDHASFYSESIPVLFFTTGAHTDYHTPMDTWDKIKIDEMADITKLIYNLTNELCNFSGKYDFKQVGSKKETRYGRRLKVTFGIIPDVANTEVNGLSVIGVRKDGPAEKAGIRAKDIITAINGEKISNIYEYMHRLNTLKPGSTVNVEIQRNGETLVLLLQL